jgi:hypothetical protein
MYIYDFFIEVAFRRSNRGEKRWEEILYW